MKEICSKYPLRKLLKVIKIDFAQIQFREPFFRMLFKEYYREVFA
jgi:hypothetical protein